MYIPSAHAESRIPVLHQLIRSNPLGVLTTAISSESLPLIQASHIPFILDAQDDAAGTDLGILRGHIARQNPQSKAMIEALTASHESTNVLEQEVLVLFTAAPHHYVTPKFYRETKPTTAKVVPTWNYAAVQAYGRATVYYDSKSEESSKFLTKQIDDLSHYNETITMDYTGREDRPGPWKVSDAPENYINILKKNIVGIEIVITRLEGKFKMSQEMRKGDRDGVVQGFADLGHDVGNAMSDMIRERSDMKEAGSRT